MTGLLLGFLLFYLAFAFGRRINVFTGGQLHPGEDAWISAGLGLAVLAYLVLALGLLHGLHPAVLWTAAGVLFVWAFLHVQQDVACLYEAFGFAGPAGRGKFAYFFAAAGLIAAFAGMLMPETGNDSLCYHLNLPKIYLMQGRIGPVPHDVNSEFPLLMEMLYALGLALGGISMAKFFHFACAFVTAGLITSSVRKLSGGWYYSGSAGLLFLTAPVILNQVSTTYVEAGLACFSFLSLFLLLTWMENPEQRLKFLTLSGAFSGFALGVKYLALISVLIQGLFIFLFSIKKEPKRLLKNLFVFAAAAAVCGGYWYVRAWLITGNPVYPYFARFFGTGDPTIQYNDIGVSKNVLSFLKVFWTATMKPAVFEGFGVQMGPGFLAFLPAAVFLIKKQPKVLWLWAYALFFLFAWFMLGQSLRFLVPVLPVLAVLIGAGLSRMKAGVPQKGLRFLFLSVIGLHAVLGVYHYRDDLKSALRREAASEYLHRNERSFRAAEFVNAHLPANAVILNAEEVHMFYFQRRMIRESIYTEMGERYWEGASDLRGVLSNLKRRGFTHILYAKRLASRKPGAPELEPLRIPSLLAKPQNGLASVLNPLYTYSFTGSDRTTTEYTIYQIL